MEVQLYDTAIIGGGIAGLSLSIQLAHRGHSVVLLEKEKYPFHKVCGEYISMESWDHLLSLGVPLPELELPVINQLLLTSPGGNSFHTKLPLGGFGISRYLLDQLLANLAREAGVHVLEEAKVEDVLKTDTYEIIYTTNEGKRSVSARLVCGSYGKRSNLDLKWRRPFVQSKPSAINNYVGIKYHIQTDWDESVIGLHNFLNGYCGISKVEGNKYCLCYLTTSQNLKNSGNSIEALEEGILMRNKHLKAILLNCEKDPHFPVTISQISFDKKSQIVNEILLIGDSAGMITPLCGNGMSMALYGSKLAAGLADLYLNNELSHSQLMQQYQQKWLKQFSSRLRTGRILQRFFGAEELSNIFVQTFKIFPFLAQPLIRQTHGEPF